jgi:hypothetical protein
MWELLSSPETWRIVVEVIGVLGAVFGAKKYTAVYTVAKTLAEAIHQKTIETDDDDDLIAKVNEKSKINNIKPQLDKILVKNNLKLSKK